MRILSNSLPISLEYFVESFFDILFILSPSFAITHKV